MNLDVKRGEIIAIVGRNGTGKSTLLRGLGGVVRPSAGRVTFPRLEDDYQNRQELLSQILLIDDTQSGWFGTVETCLRLYASLRGVRRRSNVDQVGYFIDRLRLRDCRDHEFSELSKGYQTRFALAKALVIYPRLLLLDDPLGPLDLTSRGAYLRELRDLADNPLFSIGIVVTAVDPLPISRIADRVFIVEEGSVRPVEHAPDGAIHTSIYEVAVAESNEDLVRALMVLPEVEINIDVLPHTVGLPPGISPSAICSALEDAGLTVNLLRDLTSYPGPAARSGE